MLHKAIESLADNKIPLEEGLRQLSVVAYRAQSTQLKEWVESELNGYKTEDDTPNYRRGFTTHIKLKLVGFGPSYKNEYLINLDVPEELRWWDEEGHVICQSVTELEALIADEKDPVSQLPHSWAARYQMLSEQGKATYYQGMVVNGAYIVFPRTSILRMLGNIRNHSLKMALELEDISPTLGSSSKTTDEEAQAAQQVINIVMGNMIGDVNTAREEITTSSNSNGTVNNSLQYNENAAESSNIQGDNNAMN